MGPGGPGFESRRPDLTPLKSTLVRSAIVPSRIPGVDYVLNPYVGCGFGCKFCYAHYMGRVVGRRAEDWGKFAFPKEGFLAALVRQLRRPQRYYGKYLLLGSATDPYQPVESKYRLTRRTLETFLKMAPKVNLGVLTRSPLVLRDTDLLLKLSVEVGVSISVMRGEYFREVEPISPPPDVRIHVLRRLREAGVDAYVFLAPVFPDAYRDLCAIVKTLKREDLPIRYVELLSPFKNPNLKILSRFGRWVSLIRDGSLYARFSECVLSEFPNAHVIRHGWR